MSGCCGHICTSAEVLGNLWDFHPHSLVILPLLVILAVLSCIWVGVVGILMGFPPPQLGNLIGSLLAWVGVMSMYLRLRSNLSDFYPTIGWIWSCMSGQLVYSVIYEFLSWQILWSSLLLIWFKNYTPTQSKWSGPVTVWGCDWVVAKQLPGSWDTDTTEEVEILQRHTATKKRFLWHVQNQK